LYYLCTGETLFLNNDSDNTDNNGLLQLFEWTDATKNDKLSKISDELARNLVSRLLSKDPAKRPLTSTGLHIVHVFIILHACTHAYNTTHNYISTMQIY